MTKQKNSNEENGRKSVSLNPLAWGILFFGFWLSLQAFNELSALQQGIGWFFLGLSAVLFCSIFPLPIQKLLTNPGVGGFFVALIFFVSLMGFAFSLVQSWSNLEGGSYLMYISVIGGNLWFIAFFLVLVRIVAELERVGLWFGIAICIVTVVIGIYNAITSDILAGIILIALGLGSIVVVIKKPRIWHKLPFS
jgi:hypothetical protein